MHRATSTRESTQCMYVLSDIDGYAYKLVLQGDVQLPSVKRIKQYLQTTTGIDTTQQLLSFNGVPLDDEMSGRCAEFFDGATLRLQQVPPPAGTASICTTAEKVRPLLRSIDPDSSMRRNTPRQKDASSADATPHITSTQTPRGTNDSPPLQSLSLNQLAGGSHRETQNSVLFTKQSSVADIPFPGSHQVTEPTIAAERAPQSTPPVVSSTPNADCDRLNIYSGELERKVAALSIDNVRLREQLQVVARQAAEACANWKQEEEVKRLKVALAAAQESVADAERAAALRWRVKEEELVKELDLLREERRRFQAECATQEEKLQKLVHSMEGELRALRYDLRDKEEALQEARVALSEVQRGGPLSNLGCQGGDGASTLEAAQPSLPASQRLHARYSQCQSSHSIDNLAATALVHLTHALTSQTLLELDPMNDTCVVPMSNGVKVLITLDRETDRLYLYVTLLNHMPSSPVQRMRLYEMLLEGALLGKDMAGGGVGVCLESNLILMSTSASLRLSDASLLAVTAPQFVTAACEWMQKISVLLNT